MGKLEGFGERGREEQREKEVWAVRDYFGFCFMFCFVF